MRDDLEKILQKRAAAPEPRGDLAGRIILASLETRERPLGFLQKISGMFDQLFLVPQPAYACLMILVLGVMIGNTLNFEAPADTEDMASYLEVHDTLNGGEWL